MGLEWTHSINLEIPNIRKYFWYEIVFKSPEGEQLTDEEVYKAFRNVLFASKAARVGPKNRILLLKDNDGEEVLQIKEDFIIRGGYDDFLRVLCSFFFPFLIKIKGNRRWEFLLPNYLPF